MSRKRGSTLDTAEPMMYTNVMNPYRTNTYVTVPRPRAVLFEALLGAAVGCVTAFLVSAFALAKDPGPRAPRGESWVAPAGCRPKPIMYRDFETGKLVTARTTVCDDGTSL